MMESSQLSDLQDASEVLSLLIASDSYRCDSTVEDFERRVLSQHLIADVEAPAGFVCISSDGQPPREVSVIVDECPYLKVVVLEIDGESMVVDASRGRSPEDSPWPRACRRED